MEKVARKKQSEQTQWHERGPVRFGGFWLLICVPVSLALSTSVQKAVVVVVVSTLLVVAVTALGDRFSPLRH